MHGFYSNNGSRVNPRLDSFPSNRYVDPIDETRVDDINNVYY